MTNPTKANTPVQYVMPFDGQAKTIELEHREFIAGLSKPGAAIVASLTPEKAHLWHWVNAALILAAEEADLVKKRLIYEKDVDIREALQRLRGVADSVVMVPDTGSTIMRGMTPEKAHLWHMAFAMLIEVAELGVPIVNHVTGTAQLDRANALEELGDILYYFQAIADFYGFTITQIREANMAKLRTRYPQGYTNAAAIARADKAEEQVGGSPNPQ